MYCIIGPTQGHDFALCEGLGSLKTVLHYSYIEILNSSIIIGLSMMNFPSAGGPALTNILYRLIDRSDSFMRGQKIQ